MCRRIIIPLAVAVGICAALHLAIAVQKPDGRIELKGGSVAAGVGVNWGHGMLTFKGKEYPISVTGLDVGDVGVTNVTASGNVYDLNRLSDFPGNYASIGAGATLGGGGTAVAMENQHGVRIDIVSTSQGVKLALATGGVNIQIQHPQAATK